MAKLDNFGHCIRAALELLTKMACMTPSFLPKQRPYSLGLLVDDK